MWIQSTFSSYFFCLFNSFICFFFQWVATTYIYANCCILKTIIDSIKNKRLHERTQKNLTMSSQIDRKISKKINCLHNKGQQRLLNWIHNFRSTFKYIDINQSANAHTKLFTSLLLKKKNEINGKLIICNMCWYVLYRRTNSMSWLLNLWFIYPTAQTRHHLYWITSLLILITYLMILMNFDGIATVSIPNLFLSV